MMVVARDRGGLAAFGVIEESGEAGQGRLASRARGGRMGGSPTLVQPVLHRAYFLDDHLGASINHLRFLGRFLLIALMLILRVQTVPHLAAQIRMLLDESKNLQEADYKEWRHAVQEITRFLKADSPFMNLRPLRV